MVAIFTLLVIVFISLLLNRIATVALTFTGLSPDVARFQARSAFTGTGFSTGESELVTEHPVRRRIVMTLMFLGNAGLVTVVATLMVGFVNVDEERGRDLEDYRLVITDDTGTPVPDLNIHFELEGAEAGSEPEISWGDVLLGVTPEQQIISRVLALTLGVLMLWVFASSKWVDRQLFRIIASMLRRFTRIERYDFQGILHLSEGYTVSEIEVDKDHWTTGRNLMDLRLSGEGIQVLGVTRASLEYIGAPAGQTYIRSGDSLILYGRTELIDELRARRQGHEGEEQHERRLEEHAQELAAQGAEERTRSRGESGDAD